MKVKIIYIYIYIALYLSQCIFFFVSSLRNVCILSSA
jgi:hypothetical protein